jgi:hypothetical protein
MPMVSYSGIFNIIQEQISYLLTVFESCLRHKHQVLHVERLKSLCRYLGGFPSSKARL